MQRNEDIGLFTKPSKFSLQKVRHGLNKIVLFLLVVNFICWSF